MLESGFKLLSFSSFPPYRRAKRPSRMPESVVLLKRRGSRDDMGPQSVSEGQSPSCQTISSLHGKFTQQGLHLTNELDSRM